jgi:hypothetical protein
MARNVIQARDVHTVNVFGAQPPEPPQRCPLRPTTSSNRDGLTAVAVGERPLGWPAVVVIMGLRGIGKTAVGRALGTCER